MGIQPYGSKVESSPALQPCGWLVWGTQETWDIPSGYVKIAIENGHF